MRARLEAALAPERVEIVDDSAKHVGHASARDGRGHYSVAIVSAAFEGKNRVARQRLVYAALKAELDAGLHALALTTLTPAEDRR